MCGEHHRFGGVIDWGYEEVYGRDGEFEYLLTWETNECQDCGFVKTFEMQGVSDEEFATWQDYHRQRDAAAAADTAI